MHYYIQHFHTCYRYAKMMMWGKQHRLSSRAWYCQECNLSSIAMHSSRRAAQQAITIVKHCKEIILVNETTYLIKIKINMIKTEVIINHESIRLSVIITII